MSTEPEPVAAWATDCRDKYACRGGSPQDRTYPGNHDSGYAGRICMADGNLAWAAVVSDGAGGNAEGLKVSALAVQAFVDAVRRSNLAELSDPAARDAWLRFWTNRLHEESWGRFKGGFATFCGAVILPPSDNPDDRPPGVAGWKIFALNVGDSRILELTGDGKCMGIVPDAPPNNANVEGRNPIRVVGKEPKRGFPLVDVEEFPLPAEGPCWILAGSDGFFSKKKGRDELTIFSSGDLRDVCLGSGAPFQELPALALRRSLANAQKLGAAEMMDNATVAMLGFRVPATDLAAPAVPPPPVPLERLSAAVVSGGPSAVEAPRSHPPSRGPESKRCAAEKDWKSICAAAAAAGIAGLAIGWILAPRKPVEPQPSSSRNEQRSDRVPESALPKEGRCPFCLGLYTNGELQLRETYHWEVDCPRRNKDRSQP